MSVRSGGKVAWPTPPTPPTVLPASGWKEDLIWPTYLNTLQSANGSAFAFLTAGVSLYGSKYTAGQTGVGFHWLAPSDFDPTGQLQIVFQGFNGNNAGGNFNYNLRVYGRYLIHQDAVDVAYVNFSDVAFTTTNVFKPIITPYVNFTPDGAGAALKYVSGRIDRTDANANDIFISTMRIRYKYLTGF